MNRSVKLSGLLTLVFLTISTTFTSDNGKYFEISKNIEVFTNLYKEINTYYVDDLDPGQLMRTGIDAMMESLDPYTNYISESEIESYRYITEGRYNGIGALSKKVGDFVIITELYENQPADKAGLKPGDKIIAVDGQNAVGKDREAINNILRGFPGTEVELTIRRFGVADDFKVKLVRDEVSVPNVPYHGMVSENIGYVALTTFTRNAGKNVADAIRTLKEENANLKGIIFDLRGNGGGLLTEAVNVSNIFVPKGELVVTTKGKVRDWDRSFKTLNNPVDTEIPLVVLMNNSSASASEIVAGVIQDYDRGVLLGQQSYGKGLVQNTRDVGYNSKVKLTTAKYYIPSGRCIQSVEYDNGEPVDIPEAERAIFQTRNGRKVLDGGGVKPDVKIEEPLNELVLKKLRDKNLIFDYVTEYTADKESIVPVTDFYFQDFANFTAFLAKEKFSYKTSSEALLEKLEKTVTSEELNVSAEVEAIKAKIELSKKDEIAINKETIIDLIEKEVVGRYYYKIGKIKMGLRNDKEIKEAISILNDTSKYNQILGR